MPAALPPAVPAVPAVPTHPHANPSACPNCFARLASPQPRFCPACGQETRIRPPTLGEFIQQFGGAYFSTEGALWRTLKLLLLQPGELTRQYLAGRRKHYVLPLRLYLTISLVTLLLVRIVGGAVQVELTPELPTQRLRDGKANLIIFGNAGLKDGVFFCERLPTWVCARLKRRIDREPAALAEEMTQFQDRYVSHLGGAMFVALPAFALWLRLVYRNRRMRYTEHLVFALHVHAFWFFAMALTLPGQLWLTLPAALAVPWYTLAAMRRVYGGQRWPRLLRAGVVSMLYGLTLTVVMSGLGIWLFLS